MNRNTQPRLMTEATGVGILVGTAIIGYQTSKLVELSKENNILVKEQTDLVKKIGDAQLDALNKQIMIAEEEVRRKKLERIRKQLIFELKIELDELDDSSGFKTFWKSRVITGILNDAQISSNSFDEISDKQYFTDLLKRLNDFVVVSPSKLSDEEIDDLGKMEEIEKKAVALVQQLNTIIALRNLVEKRRFEIEEDVKNKKKDLFTVKGSLIFSIICIVILSAFGPKQGDPPNWAVYLCLCSLVLVAFTILRRIKRVFKPVSLEPTSEDYDNDDELKMSKRSIQLSALKIFDDQEFGTSNIRLIDSSGSGILKHHVENLYSEFKSILCKHGIV